MKLRQSWSELMQMVRSCNVLIMNWWNISLFWRRYSFLCYNNGYVEVACLFPCILSYGAFSSVVGTVGLSYK